MLTLVITARALGDFCCAASQAFLQRMMALCVASHYRNTPNDLILMSDAPAHHLFALLGPVDESKASCPRPRAAVIWCALQRCEVVCITSSVRSEAKDWFRRLRTRRKRLWHSEGGPVMPAIVHVPNNTA